MIRAGPIPSADSLRFDIQGVNVGDVRIDDRGFSTVQTDSALKVLSLKSVNPQTIEDQVMRHGGKICLRIASESDESAVTKLRSFSYPRCSWRMSLIGS